MAKEGICISSSVYHGDALLGEVNIMPQYDDPFLINGIRDTIRVSHLSAQSDRCPPLAVLHTISPTGVFIKVESKENQDNSLLKQLYITCLKEAKAAIIPVQGRELLLVAMLSKSRVDQLPCFWGYDVSSVLYNACLGMLNLRCLAIVFDLDETLIVANTLRSFEDKIDAIQRKLLAETDPSRVHGMVAEVTRYQEDRAMLKQYADADQIVDSNGMVLKAVTEFIPPHSDRGQSISRPLIRIQDKNMIFTRINPNIRDTSVLVRLRPAWEELRTYLTLKGRKRFEVYICTMSERDYALEMWRLLDGESRLINHGELLDRVLCVKPGSRKALGNVFRVGFCHPKLAMVIDDRLKVWEDRDQPRVHVVPPFAPYYAPQAETSCPVPVLCVARNVACNVRGGFFKDFDEVLLQKLAEVVYEFNVESLPPTPDVSNYLLTDDDLNVNKDLPLPEGMADSELEKKLGPQETNQVSLPNIISSGIENQPVVRPCDSTQPTFIPLVANHGRIPLAAPLMDQTQVTQQLLPIIPTVKPYMPQSHVRLDCGIQTSPPREEGEVPESEVDPDTRRRLLILQHGQDTGKFNGADPGLPARLQVTVPPNQVPGGWLGAEEEMSPRQIVRTAQGPAPQQESFGVDKPRFPQTSLYPGSENPLVIDRGLDESKRMTTDEASFSEERLKSNHIIPESFSHSEDEDSSLNKTSSNCKTAQGNLLSASNCISALYKIAEYCNTKVDFRSWLSSARELEFSVEVLFDGKKIGVAVGKTKKEAQQKASFDALKNMASQYMSQVGQEGAWSLNGQIDTTFSVCSDEEGLRESCNALDLPIPKGEDMPVASTSGQSRFPEQRLAEDFSKSHTAIQSLKDVCTEEGLTFVFEKSSIGVANRTELCAQVEVGGQILGKGRGLTWEEAKQEAAEEALHNFKSTFTQRTLKRMSSPRPISVHSSKRLKPADISRGPPRIPPSPRRYSKSGSSIP